MRIPYLEPSQTYTVEATFTTIDTTPLRVTADVGAIFLKRETAQFYIQTAFKGAAVDPTSIQVRLDMPDGTTQTLQVEKIGTGLYLVKYALGGKGSMNPRGFLDVLRFGQTVIPILQHSSLSKFLPI